MLGVPIASCKSKKMKNILIDSGSLIALFDRNDKYHSATINRDFDVYRLKEKKPFTTLKNKSSSPWRWGL